MKGRFLTANFRIILEALDYYFTNTLAKHRRLRRCTTSRRVPDSNPDFNLPNPSTCTIAVGCALPLAEMSDTSGEQSAAGASG
jgi:hypothetical protein